MTSSTQNVLHVASGDLWAGAEVQLFTLATTLQNNFNTKVTVALMNFGELERRLRSAGVSVIVIDEKRLNSLRVFLRLLKLIRDLKPDIVHTHRTKENILGSLAAFITGCRHSIRTLHGAPEHLPGWRKPTKYLLVWLDQMTGRYLQDFIIAVTYPLAEQVKDIYPGNKIRVVENGLNISSALKAHKIAPSKFIIGFAGRLVGVKRVDIIIKIARELLDQYPEFEFEVRIYGDGPLKEELEQLNKAMGTEEVISFRGHSNNIHEEIQQMNTFLMTSDHEGLPMSLLEAMLLGVPIIAHAVGGIPKLLREGENGIMIKSQDPQDYANWIHQLANDHELCNRISKKAMLYATENYSAESNAKNYLSIYLELARSI